MAFQGLRCAAVGQPVEHASAQHQQLLHIPESCNVLVAERVGASFREVARVKRVRVPKPGADEVLVKMTYAGVNGGCETFRVRGQHAFARNRGLQDFSLGAEGAGIVVALGEGVSSLKVGQPVAVNGASAFAEYTVAKAASCQPVAEADGAAVALTLSAVTACTALEVTGGMTASDAVLVTAAAGGTGHFAVQLAALAGCRTVVALCGAEHKAVLLRQLGATHVINYKQQDVTAAVLAAVPGGVDLVYEGVGGELQRAVLAATAPGARVLQVGYISEYPHVAGDQAPVARPYDEGAASLAEVFWGGRTLHLGGCTVLGRVWPSDPAAVRRCRRRVFALHATGELKAVVDSSAKFEGLAAVPDAIEHMLKGQHVGKVVVKIQDP